MGDFHFAMGNFQTTFTVAIFDNRNGNSIVHAAKFYLKETEGKFSCSLLKEPVYVAPGSTVELGRTVTNHLYGTMGHEWYHLDQEQSVTDLYNVTYENLWRMRNYTKDDLLNGNWKVLDGNWDVLARQSVADTVRNMFIELVKKKGLPGISNNLIDSSDVSYWRRQWMEGSGDDMIGNVNVDEITNDVVGGLSLADLIGRFKLSNAIQNNMFVTSLLTLQ